MKRKLTLSRQTLHQLDLVTAPAIAGAGSQWPCITIYTCALSCGGTCLPTACLPALCTVGDTLTVSCQIC